MAGIVKAKGGAPRLARQCGKGLGFGARHVGFEAAKPEQAAAANILAAIFTVGEFCALGCGFELDIAHGRGISGIARYEKPCDAGNAPSNTSMV